MKTIEWNDGWKYRRINEETFREVILPHDAMLSEKRGNSCASGTHGAWFEGHDYEYVKEFSLLPEWSDKKVILEFEGVYSHAEVYINGKKVAYRPYGFTNFYVPLEESGEIRVVAHNSDQPNCRWYAGAGIYRPVKLHILPQRSLDINGIKIRTTDYATREMEVLFISDKNFILGSESGCARDSEAISAYQEVLFSVCDGEKTLYEGRTKIGEKTRFEIENAELWCPHNPKLYTLKVVYGEDKREIPFGIRQVTVSRSEGFTLNGERIILRGACIHSDNGLLGAAAHPFADRRKIELLKAVGYNAVRSAHNPCSKATLDACDRLGMLVLDEYTDGWYIHKTRFDYASYMEEWWQKDFQGMVDKDYNHPSVVMYSTGNEVSETAQKKGIELTGRMTQYLHSLDDTRPVTCGVNIFFNFLSSLGFGVYSDEKAEKGEHVGSAFFNNIAGIFGDKTMKIGATLHGCDVKTRDAFANMDVAGYNYGILRYKKDLKKYPERIIVGSETFCNDAYRFYEFAKKNPRVIGDFVWAGMDYLGEVGIGSWEYASYAKDFSPRAGWISAGSGRLDLTGRELGEALYTRVAFGLDTIRMAVIPADDFGKPHSPSAWKMSNARESWAWNGCEGRKTRVEVYARARFVELKLNGKTIGRKRVDLKKNCLVSFKTKYFPGELTAIAYDQSGKECGRTSLSSGKGTPRLLLTPEKISVGKDELAYIRIRYVDEDGKTLPLCRGRVKVSAENGQLLALGHACPYNPDGYLKDETDTYYGEALAILRPLPSGEKIRLLASSPFGEAETAVEVI